MKSKRHTPGHITVKFTKAKEIILKAAREKKIISYKGSSKRLSANFSSETLEARRQ